MRNTTQVKAPWLPVKDSLPHSELPQQISPPEKVDVYEDELVRAYLNGVDIEPDSSADRDGSLYDRARKSKPKQFPTGKPGRYSKDRRYIPTPKKSDIVQIHSGTGKGARSKKQKLALNKED